MKIFIIAHMIRVGGGRATCMNILNSLRDIDNQNQYFILLPDQKEYRALKLENENIKTVYFTHRFGYLKRILFDKFTVPKLVREFQPDIVWAMGGFGVTKRKMKQVISIQNPYVFLSDKKYWGRLTFFNKVKRSIVVAMQKRIFINQLPNTDLVIFQSAAIEDAFYRLYRFDSGNTLVTGKAFSALIDQSDAEIPSELKSIENKFKFIYVTRYYTHKGIELLVDTFDKYRNELKNIVVVLTITPDQHPNAKRILEEIKEKKLEDYIISVGRIDQKDLGKYYNNCDALLMPSLMESFSGSYLEAMQFEKPVVTSNLPFAREVCGDSAIYFDPWNHTEIKDSILKLVNDPKLQDQLKKSGLERLNTKYIKTWKDIASRILDQLKQLEQK